MLERARNAGVTRILLTGFTYDDSILRIAEQGSQQCKIKVGIHPWYAINVVDEVESYMIRMEHDVIRIVEEKPSLIGAFGDIGLDYGRFSGVTPEAEREAHRAAQRRIFRRMLHLITARNWNLPVIFICIDAWEDFVSNIVDD